MNKPRALPEPLKLRRHLDACTVPELEEFLRFWSPHFEPTDGRSQLVEELCRVMSDENVVYAKVDLLSEKVRAVLMQLLNKTHYVANLQELFRGVDGLEMEHYEAEAALTALARRGFVRQTRSQEWVPYGRTSYAIPQETALVMRGLAGTDRRRLHQVFLHAGFRPAGVEAAANETLAPLPDAVSDAIDDLPTPQLRKIARVVIGRYGGILTRHEFGDIFAARGIRWDSAAFLQEFGRRGLGTVGHLDLRGKGVGVDDDALFFFAEVVERFVGEWRGRPPEHDVVLTAHGDLMSDVCTTLDEIRASGVRVAKEGAVYKTARSRLAEKLQFPPQPLLDRTEIADRALALARGLGLAQSDGGDRLALTEKGEAWPGRPLLEKVREAYGLFRDDAVETLRSRHLRKVRRIVVELLTAEGEEDGWWPDAAVALLARNRYLLDLERDESPAYRVPLTIRQAALTELGRAAQDLVVRDLFALGLVDVALRGQEPAGVRLSRLGRRVLLDTEERPATETRPLVVNPDFELIVLPEGDIDDLLHALDRVAVRERAGQVVHYRLARERIERAAAAGATAEETIALLEARARKELPQNVAYSIRAWTDGVRSGTLERGVLFATSDPSVVQTVCNHPALKGFVLRVVEPNAILFDEKVLERPIVQELESLGIYVR